MREDYLFRDSSNYAGPDDFLLLIYLDQFSMTLWDVSISNF